MLLSVTTGMTATVLAADNQTARAAVDSICATAGYRPGVDSYGDCYAFAKAFCNKLYGCYPGGISSYNFNNPGNFYMVAQTAGTGVTAATLSNVLSQALPGDVLQMRWQYTSNGTTKQSNHTAIVYSSDTSSITVLQDGASWQTIQKTNYAYSSSYFRWSGTGLGISVYRYNNYSGKFGGGSSGGSYIPTPVVGDNKNIVSVGEEITFWYSGLTECSKAEFYFEKNGKVYYVKDSTSSREFATYFENEGTYNVYAGGYYNGQWYYSPKITVFVFNPSLVSNKTSVNTNEEIAFTYSGLSAAQKVNICFEKDGVTYYEGDSTSSRVYKNYFENPGIYYVYAKGILSDYSTTSNKIKITVNCQHTYNEEITKPATCTDTGVATYTCSACGATKTETINPIGHVWDEGAVTTPATEIDNGIMTYTCVNCSDTKEVVIPVLTHTHTASEAVKENEIAPTCTKAGSYDLVVYCSLGDNYEFSRETVPVSATGHSFTNYVSNCDATCTSDGTKTAKCDNCNVTDTIVDEDTALGHDYKSVITNPSCIERGYTTHICKFCGDSYISDYTEISEHTIVFDDAVAATCTQNGATAGAHCSVCGKVFIAQDAVDALGHTWNEGTVTKNSTYTETGIKEYRCTVCGAIKTETVQKLPKKANTLTVKAKKPTVKFAKLKKKNQTIARKYAITVSKAKGTVTYTKSSGNKKITINKKTGNITVKKGLKKGTYKVKVKVTAVGNSTYKSSRKIVTVTIKVK